MSSSLNMVVRLMRCGAVCLLFAGIVVTFVVCGAVWWVFTLPTRLAARWGRR